MSLRKLIAIIIIEDSNTSVDTDASLSRIGGDDSSYLVTHSLRKGNDGGQELNERYTGQWVTKSNFTVLITYLYARAKYHTLVVRQGVCRTEGDNAILCPRVEFGFKCDCVISGRTQSCHRQEQAFDVIYWVPLNQSQLYHTLVVRQGVCRTEGDNAILCPRVEFEFKCDCVISGRTQSCHRQEQAFDVIYWVPLNQSQLAITNTGLYDDRLQIMSILKVDPVKILDWIRLIKPRSLNPTSHIPLRRVRIRCLTHPVDSNHRILVDDVSFDHTVLADPKKSAHVLATLIGTTAYASCKSYSDACTCIDHSYFVLYCSFSFVDSFSRVTDFYSFGRLPSDFYRFSLDCATSNVVDEPNAFPFKSRQRSGAWDSRTHAFGINITTTVFPGATAGKRALI
ncbi:hypothetical protein CLF_106978 [Clonorchis sinensis]|uniref:Uncharacterized protein n=1 Tax=Clonorchis sinensis TaxID=79923 RepID=G7YG14_CLOSI|nr:hypothetical protein CLF_106978 [Clonorchis sinensis]